MSSFSQRVDIIDYGRRTQYDLVLTHQPAANTLATVTFPATLGHYWVIDLACWSLRSGGTLSSRLCRILDGVTVVFNAGLSVTVTSGDSNAYNLGPGAAIAGAIGNAVTVTFDAIPGASDSEIVTAGAYLV